MRSAILYALLTMVMAGSFFAAPARATQRERVFVASYGSDSNPCTFGSPCKTFQHAHDTVAAGGEVTAIDSAGFGMLTISKAVTITSPAGVEAGIAAGPGDFAITVIAGPNDTVVLSGLTLEGGGTAADGIVLDTGLRLEVVNCAVRNFTGGGIVMQPQVGATSLLISNTAVSGIAGGSGVNIFTGGTATIQAALNNVNISSNFTGLYMQGGPLEVQVANSHIDNNTQDGIFASGTSSADSINLILKNVTLNQTPTGIALSQGSNVWLSRVTQTAAAGFSSIGIVFSETTDNAAFSDNTNHLMGGVSGGTLQGWPTQ